jgi:hypothetical protein
MNEVNNTDSVSTDMTDKLKEAGEKAEIQKTERTARVVKGSHLNSTMKTLVSEQQLEVKEMSGFLKVNGGVKKKNLYIAKKGGCVDFSGFTVESDAVTQISEAEAKAKHLGKVRGRLNFEKSDKEVLEAFSAALKSLKSED